MFHHIVTCENMKLYPISYKNKLHRNLVPVKYWFLFLYNTSISTSDFRLRHGRFFKTFNYLQFNLKALSVFVSTQPAPLFKFVLRVLIWGLGLWFPTGVPELCGSDSEWFTLNSCNWEPCAKAEISLFYNAVFAMENNISNFLLAISLARNTRKKTHVS